MIKQEKIISISELTEYIKTVLNKDPILQNVTVRGELSNFYHHSSGHLYFTMKDSNSQLKCVMFRSNARRVKFEPENGMNLIATGSISIYPARGEYQLYVNDLQPDGIGALHLAFEQLKKKLKKEGLFDKEAKKPIPKLPRRIGVITSPTGAAVRDIISVIQRRFPHVEIVVAPALVQGEGAKASLVRSIELLQRDEEDIDVLIIGRGGGSIEDLWGFNEELVARAIYHCSIPVISAVGHETDFTIADFVADLRAPTPSAAAELAVGNFEELKRYLDTMENRLEHSLKSRVDNLKERLTRLKSHPIFQRPEEVFLKSWQQVDDLERRLHQSMKNQVNLTREKTMSYIKQLESLSPLNVLKRGYSVSEKFDGQVLKSIDDVEPGEKIKVRLSDGELKATIDETGTNL